MNPIYRLSPDGRTLTVTVSMEFKKRGGRKLIVTPDGSEHRVSSKPRIDSTLVKALARAFRWRRMMEEGRFSSINELARVERMNKSYICRVLRLSLLAPDVVQAILDGQQPVALTLASLLKPFPVQWSAQRQRFLAMQ